MGYKMLQATCHKISQECIMNKVRFVNTYQQFWKRTIDKILSNFVVSTISDDAMATLAGRAYTNINFDI